MSCFSPTRSQLKENPASQTRADHCTNHISDEVMYASKDQSHASVLSVPGVAERLESSMWAQGLTITTTGLEKYDKDAIRHDVEAGGGR